VDALVGMYASADLSVAHTYGRGIFGIGPAAGGSLGVSIAQKFGLAPEAYAGLPISNATVEEALVRGLPYWRAGARVEWAPTSSSLTASAGFQRAGFIASGTGSAAPFRPVGGPYVALAIGRRWDYVGVVLRLEIAMQKNDEGRRFTAGTLSVGVSFGTM
jgi:hypothetical protein